MRPLAVLALVLCSVLALVFAYVSISDRSESRGNAVQNVVKPADPEEARPDVDFVEAAPREEVARTEVETTATEGPAATGGWPNVLQGTVFSPGHVPVSGALVSVYREGTAGNLGGLAVLLNPEAGQKKAMRTTRTDDQGTFELKGLPPSGAAMIVVEHEDYQRAEVLGVQIPEKGEVREDVSLEEGFRIFGYVTSHDTGGPIQGATLVLDSPLAAQLPASRPSPDRMSATSGEDGRYEFEHVAPGTMWLTCAAEGFATMVKNDVSILATAGTDRHMSIDMRLRQELKISGRVVGPDRQGIPDATLDATSYNAEALSRGNAVTDEDGNYVIRGLGEAEYSIVARAPGYGEVRKIRNAAPAENLTFELTELGGVMGRVVDGSNGRALRNFHVSARMVNQTGTFVGRVAAQANVRGAENGSFHLRGLNPGTYVVQASAEGFADTRSDVFSVSQGLTVPEVLVQMSRGGTLTGVILDGYTGAPLVGAVVSTQENNWIDSPFTKALGSLTSRTTTEAVARTDKDGSFELELLTPGDYQINVVHPDYTTSSMNDVRVFEGQEKPLGTLKLFQGARLIGQVFTGDGRRAVGATVSLHPTDGVLSRNYEARTNSEGMYSFKNLAPGSYTLSAARARQDGNPFGVIVDMKHSEVQISLVDQREYTYDLRLE
jgi:protocatechuate 3,4-dioxygenase beta subunit